MKRKLLFVPLLLIAGMAFAQTAPSDADIIKANDKKMKETRKTLNEKAGKTARVEGKKLMKEGYGVSPGALPLKKQLDYSYLKLSEKDADGYPLWYTSSTRSTANTAATAKFSAIELAKLDIAGQLGSNISGLVENSLANEQISEDEATSIQKTIAASTNLISASLGRVLTFSEFYKSVGDGNMQCAVTIGTNAKLAEVAAKKVVRKKLEEETKIVRSKLDKILGIEEEPTPAHNHKEEASQNHNHKEKQEASPADNK